MTGFSFETTPRILCEDGAALKLAEFLNGMGVRRPFIVTDAGLVGAGVVQPILDGLDAAGVTAAVFSDVLADPPEASVMAAVAAARAARADGVVGLGGGSSLDTAKLVALLAGTDQALPDIYGIGLARGPRLPLVQVPTTAGTGSEVTNIAIVTTPDDQKKGVVSPLLYPDAAVLDATLTTGLPPRVTAMTGVDAMVHAIEAYTSRHKKNPVSDSLAVAALKLLHANIRRVIADGSDLPARRAMLQGSLLAGMAFANAPVAAVHALAYPIGGIFHAPHGLSNALVLGPVLRFNLPAAAPLYAELAAAIGLKPDAAAFVDEIAALTAEMPMEQRLSELGVEVQHLDRLAHDALQVQRLLTNNPREVTLADARALYEEAL
ncbi:MAG: iron-containing alcohol dehydrogenase [Brevundimonas sp.]